MEEYHHDNDGDEKIYDAIEKWNEREQSRKVKEWTFTPQSVTALLGVMGMFGVGIFGYADYRVAVNNMNERVTSQAQRILEVEKRVDSLDSNGSRVIGTIQPTIKILQDQINELKDTTKDLDRSLLQHNEAMMDLYRKDVADGKRDFKIPSNPPKYDHGRSQ